MTRRKYNFPHAVLVRSAGLLKAALEDAAYKPALEERLDPGFAAAFTARLTALGVKTGEQSSLTGDISSLTGEQRERFEDVERLSAGARRSAKLAFNGQATILREEFQVGVNDSKSLAAELQRARKTHAAAVKYAAELKTKGWIARDTEALDAAITALGGKDIEQEQSLDERLGFTSEKVEQANAIYHDCLVIQNAARLEYPSAIPANITARARFLLDEFPPRDRSEPDGGTQGGAPPPAPPAS